MAMITIAGVDMPDPCALKCSRIDVSTPKSGRDECAEMHKMIVARKRKYAVTWKQLDPTQTQTILNAVESGAHVACTVYDPRYGQVSGTFTVGDRETDWQQWLTRSFDDKLFKTVTFDLIEV